MKKERPADCCTNPVAPAAIAASERERLVAGFRALGDPIRLEIFRLVAAQEAPISGGIAGLRNFLDRLGLEVTIAAV